jgi:hypothetical protein
MRYGSMHANDEMGEMWMVQRLLKNWFNRLHSWDYKGNFPNEDRLHYKLLIRQVS